MKILLLFILGSVLQFNVAAQGQTGTVEGLVLDAASNTSLDLATVTIFSKDSVFVNFQLSDKDGHFKIHKIPFNSEFRLNVTYAGYIAFDKFFTLTAKEPSTNVTAKLSINLNDSDAVVINSVIPIRMNGDTLEINPAGFKLDKNAVAEDLLNQVPGITIWADGNITLNGKPIPKILVDGKPFLNNADHSVATQNLPKTSIDKIQIFTEVDRTKEVADSRPQDSVLTMNIKLKEDSKKGYFGKAGVGYGTDKRYEADLSFQVYNKKNTLGIGGGINNINKSIGSLQQMFSNNTYRNSNPNLYNVSNFSRAGINKSFTLGSNFTHYFQTTSNGRNVKALTAAYSFTNNNNFYDQKSIQERTTRNFPQLVESSSTTNGNNRSNVAELKYEERIGQNHTLNLSANGNINNGDNDSYQFTSVKDSNRVLQNSNQSNTKSKNRSDSKEVSLNITNYNQQNVLKRYFLTMRINAGNSAKESMVKSNFKSYTDPSDDTAYNRTYNNNGENFTASFNLNYLGLKRLLVGRFNLFGVDLTLLQNFTFTQNSDNTLVNDYDNNGQLFIKNNKLSNYNKLQNISSNPGLVMQKKFSKNTSSFYKSSSLTFRAMQFLKKEINSSSFAFRNVTRSFSYFSPNLSFSHNISKRDKFRFNYRIGLYQSFNFPTLDQLYPIVDSINLYSIRIGNPNLKNTRLSNSSFEIDLNREKPKAKFGYSVSGNINYSLLSNPVSDSIINEPSGRRKFYLINAGSANNLNFSYNANLVRKYKKNSLQLQYRGSQFNNHSKIFIDGLGSNSTSRNVTNDINLQYSLRNKFILKLSEIISTYQSSQSNLKLSSYKTTNISTQLGATLNYPKHTSFASTVAITDNSNLDKNMILWHAYATHRFLKGQQGEIKFSAFDILKKFQNISNYAGQDSNTTTFTNGLKQYFLITFSYFPRRFGNSGKTQNNE